MTYDLVAITPIASVRCQANDRGRLSRVLFMRILNTGTEGFNATVTVKLCCKHVGSNTLRVHCESKITKRWIVSILCGEFDSSNFLCFLPVFFNNLKALREEKQTMTHVRCVGSNSVRTTPMSVPFWEAAHPEIID